MRKQEVGCQILAQLYLPVGKDGGVVALEAALDQLLRAGGVDGVLLRVHVEHVVVGEGLVLPQDHLGLPGHHVGADVASLDLFPGQLRADPEETKRSSLFRPGSRHRPPQLPPTQTLLWLPGA